MQFDQWGPMVLNVDGSISRITNWDKMAPVEQVCGGAFVQILLPLGIRVRTALYSLPSLERRFLFSTSYVC